MKVTVADCLELDAFAKAKVVAAKVNLTNEVKSISVLDASSEDELCFYEGDKTEILLTGFAGVQEDADAQCRILHHIATRGYAALAVYHSGGLVAKTDRSGRARDDAADPDAEGCGILPGDQ